MDSSDIKDVGEEGEVFQANVENRPKTNAETPATTLEQVLWTSTVKFVVRKSVERGQQINGRFHLQNHPKLMKCQKSWRWDDVFFGAHLKDFSTESSSCCKPLSQRVFQQKCFFDELTFTFLRLFVQIFWFNKLIFCSWAFSEGMWSHIAVELRTE